MSYFANRGKKTATEAFQSVMLHPDSMTEDAVSAIERYTGLLYNRTSNQTSLDAARMELFVKKGRGMDEIPPTKDAFHLYLRRSIFQGAFCWGRSLELQPDLPCPSEWGWCNLDGWQPVWSTLPRASLATRELLRCGCQKGCRNACRCRKAALKCTALCSCGGDCCD